MKKNSFRLLSLIFILLLASCNSQKKAASSKSKTFKNSAEASYYADKFNGRKTASGAIFSNSKLTAAHKTLTFGTKLKVTNLANSKSVEVEVNDRGPFVKTREIDLSKKAFMQITDNKNKGVLTVKIEFVN